MSEVFVVGAFDDPRFADFRFLEEAAKLGAVHAILWPDEAVVARTGRPPRFPLAERQYLLESIRYIRRISVDSRAPRDAALIAREGADAGSNAGHIVSDAVLNSVPPAPTAPLNPPSDGKKVIVTGCYDWFHSGHLRFFEECASLGDLYVTVGSDENIHALKGQGHPLFPAAQRRFIVGAVRFVKQALIASGAGWLDAEPEIEKIRPDIYAVNEDGDKPEKRFFCQERGIEYYVLRREPKSGLPRRASTAFRGF